MSTLAKQHGHIFSRLTRPIVTANAKFLGCRFVALFIESGRSGVSI
jgi:hypothetical protein